jgi:hypothetical protein
VPEKKRKKKKGKKEKKPITQKEGLVELFKV